MFIKTWKAKNELKFSGSLGLAWEYWCWPLTCNIFLVSFYFMLSVALNLSYCSAPNICNPLTTYSWRWKLVPSGEKSLGHGLSWTWKWALEWKRKFLCKLVRVPFSRILLVLVFPGVCVARQCKHSLLNASGLRIRLDGICQNYSD